ncbi:anthrone oxygenase family protein [Nocardiopsis ganjiahuensis]|uniref:anthrone oxygenase family protein n=1 Tax=Nocardiopsis ganjiahuensis TaxID=239984 RepID=UPI0003786B78|nr:anthrone oxygenase family protein [Nocardiopsis ganjiahuensis]
MTEMVFGVVPVLAAVLTGLFAGLFLAFSMAVMPGLARAGDQAMVEAMQGINTAILNPLFALVFVGAPVAALGSLALFLASGAHVSAAWAGAALVLLVVTVVVTFTVNVPRNNALERAGAAERIKDPAAARAAFEPVWVRWNHLRSLASVAALACSVVALVTG